MPMQYGLMQFIFLRGGLRMADNRIITALDVHSLDDMKKLVESLGDSVSFYKSAWNYFTAPVRTLFAI